MGNFLTRLPKLVGYGSPPPPLQKINHLGKWIWYFQPPYGSDSREITGESQKMYS